MPDTTIDPYTTRQGEILQPPVGLRERIKYLGPGVIVAGSVVGSGELILTSSLGAAAGFALLWWILISCWSKSLVQAEITRYIVSSGDTYYRAMNRIPGRIWRLSWPVWIALIGFIPGVTGLGGIVGGAGQALTLLIPQLDPTWAAGFVAFAATIILSSGSYKWLERIMLVLVISFTIATLICSIAMQFTEYSVSPSEIIGGLSFDFPIEYAAIALAAYGYTGVNSAEIAAYTYWCVEKGYPSFMGKDHDDPEWMTRARGWIKVVQTDVWLVLIILTCATLPYYILGAGVLNQMGERPNGSETLAALSNMFTQTLGPWAMWLFGIGAFFILFSSVVSGIGAGGRFFPDYFIEMKLFDRSNIDTRRKFIRGYVSVVPGIAFLIFLLVKNPVLLVMIGGLTYAITMPIQTFATLWLQSNRMDPRIRPGNLTRICLILIFLFQFVMALFVAWFVVIEPRLN